MSETRLILAIPHIVWLMLEYAFLRFEPEAWHDPLRRTPRRRSARRKRGAAA